MISLSKNTCQVGVFLRCIHLPSIADLQITQPAYPQSQMHSLPEEQTSSARVPSTDITPSSLQPEAADVKAQASCSPLLLITGLERLMVHINILKFNYIMD